MTTDSDVTIDVQHLRMRYGAREVLRDIRFQAHRGELLAVLGPNGAGKTSAFEVLEGFRKPTAGQVRVLGVDPAHGGQRWRADIGVVLQSWRDHGQWRAGQLLAHVAGYYGPYSDAEITRPWDPAELLDLVGLTAHAGARVDTLSGGQRRRLDVALGIVGRPRVLFLDEPAAGLDPQARADLHDLIHRLTDQQHTTVLLSTHDLDEAAKLADRILILGGGRIVAAGSPDELTRRVGNTSEIHWANAGQRFVHTTADATAFVRDLLGRFGSEISELEVRRASLEQAYLSSVHEGEYGGGPQDQFAPVQAGR